MNPQLSIARDRQTLLRTREGVRAAILAGALFLTYAFFYQAGGWNQNSRFDLIRAVVDKHTLRIDDYRANTGDWARVDGHYYSDKAPGLALVSVPPVAAARTALNVVDIDPRSPEALTILSYFATLLGAAAPTALTAFGIYWLAWRLGAKSAGATFAAVAFGLATPMWAYATLFWGHALTAALLFGGFAAAVCLRDRGSERRDVLLGGLVGVAVGWATVSEFTSVLPAVLIVGLTAKHVWDRAVAIRVRILAAVAGGTIACGIVLLFYNVATFGSPFAIGYSHVVQFPEQGHGIFGVGVPDLGVLREILFGTYRGLLFFAPVVIVAPIGLYLIATTRERLATVLVAGLIPVYYLLINAGYAYWQGGATYGPRLLAPALPFLCLPLAALWTRVRVPFRMALVALVLWGAALALMAQSTTVEVPETYTSPVSQLLWPSFRDGRFSLNSLTFDESGLNGPPPLSVQAGNDRAARNLGERIGLVGHASLVPLFLLWLAAAVAWWFVGRRRRQGQHDADERYPTRASRRPLVRASALVGVRDFDDDGAGEASPKTGSSSREKAPCDGPVRGE